MDVFIKFAADGLLAVIVLVGGVALLKAIPKNKILTYYPFAIMAGLTALLIGKLMSLLYQPAVARPFLELGVAPGALYIDNPGFPSDHALLGGVVALAVYALTPYRKLSILLGITVLVMGTARVLALVHTPLDVVGGIIAALLGGLWYFTRRKVTSR